MRSKFLIPSGWPALLVLSLLLASCAAVPAPKLPPANSAELIGNFLLALDQNRLVEEAFYRDEAVKAFTGGSVVRTSVVTEQPTCILETKVTFPHPAPVGLEVYISLQRKVAAGRIVEVSGRFEFTGIGNGMAEVLSTLGPACHEDFEAEQAAFNAIAREPFNPPAKPVFMASCDLGPTKTGAHKWMSLDFGSDRRLHGAYFKAG